MGLRLLITASLLCGALGCDDLDEFRVEGDEVFEGPVVGSDDREDAGPSGPGCAFVLCGFAERTSLSLRDFDPDGLGGPEPRGTIRTSDGVFDDATFVSIPGLQHDALSEYTFPGGGRIRNFMVGARFGQDAARYAIVFVSLMENGRVELRIHAPATAPGGSDALFGVFRLCRGGCGP